ncbi:MAG: DNA polymerase III subunit beta [Geminicoccaceae bacterium]
MKLSIERSDLLRALAHVQSVVERRNTIPILSNVRLSAEDERLILTATDMDLTVVEHARAELAAPGTTTVSAHTFYDIVRKLPAGAQISLARVEDGELSVSAGKARFTLPVLPADDFPHVLSGDKDADELEHGFSVAAETLIRLIDKTRFAISTEETRYYLNGIFLHAHEQGATSTLRAVATDGHRLAMVETDLPAGAEGMPAAIVPRKAVLELRKLLDEVGDDVQVRLSDSRIQFTVGSAVLHTRLIDGTFPDYERVIPKGNDKILRLDNKAFAEAVDRVQTIATEKSRAVKLSLASGSLTLSAVSPDAGRAEEQIDVMFEHDLDIGFNARYILDMTEQIDGDEIELVIEDAGSPTLVKDPADTATLYVLMPMRV